jgi:hypothetical protein
VSVKGGVYDRPFGYEISYSSARRESAEHSRIVQTLFPDERDLGAMFTIQAPKTSPWNVLKLEAGLFAGNSVYQETDSKKDFIGHLSYSKSIASNMKIGLGASLYSGLMAQTDTNVYVMNNGAFKRNIGTSPNGFAQRQYYGFDGQFSASSVLGLTTFLCEYIIAEQPGRSDNTGSPKSGLIPGKDAANVDIAAGTPTYIRNMAGGYVYFIQDIAQTKHSIVVKYDWYDPNTKIKGDKVGVAGSKTGKADMAYTTLGFGYLYRMNNNVRIMAYYDMISNEETKFKGFFKDVNDNLVTVRVQYKF